jgi:hypothetical protein
MIDPEHDPMKQEADGLVFQPQLCILQVTPDLGRGSVAAESHPRAASEVSFCRQPDAARFVRQRGLEVGRLHLRMLMTRMCIEAT